MNELINFMKIKLFSIIENINRILIIDINVPHAPNNTPFILFVITVYNNRTVIMKRGPLEFEGMILISPRRT